MAQPHEGSNSFDRDQLVGFLDEIKLNDDKLLELKIDYMQRCKEPRAQIREIMAVAKEAGVNMKALRTKIAGVRADNAHERRIAKLEADDLADFEEIERVLGDYGSTPLGEAALKRAKANEEALDTLSC